MREAGFHSSYSFAKRSLLFISILFPISTLACWFYGYLLVERSLQKLVLLTLQTEAKGGFVLPGSSNLANLTKIFKFNAGLFTGISLGVLIATIGVFFFFAGAVKRWQFSLRGSICWIGSISLSLSLISFFSSMLNLPAGFKSFRDRILLTNNIGLLINDFYYIHSPYAAKSIGGEENAFLRDLIGMGILLLPIFCLITLILLITIFLSGIIITLEKKVNIRPIVMTGIMLISALLIFAVGGAVSNNEIRKMQVYQSGNLKVSGKEWEFLVDKLKKGDPGEGYEVVYAISMILKRENLYCFQTCIQLLIEHLQDKNINIRMRSAYALGMLGDKNALPHLIKLLSDDSLNVRYAAIDAIGKIGDPLVIPILEEVLKKDIWYVGIYADNAIKKIRNRGEDHKKQG